MIGETISHYQVVEKLGEGGMGEVYKARDPRLNRTVAIKVLSARAMGDPDRRRRFILEAQAASSLNHPNIITIHDIITDANTEYMVMEYVTGKTLADVIAEGRVSVENALHYGVQIADALAAAHAAGIVHRDLKPGNIMVTDSGLVKILDFGLAKVTVQSGLTDETLPLAAPATVEGTLHGTINYMSPEQAQGGKIDARSDIFSFGTLMYEVVTGKRAFPGPSLLDTLTAILRDEPHPIRESAPECPPELAAVIERAMRKAPGDRWQNMREVQGVLAVLRQKSESGILYGATPARVERKPARAAWLGAAGLVAVLGIGGVIVLRQKGNPAAPQPAAPAPAPVAKAPARAVPREKRPSPAAEKAKQPGDGALTNRGVIELAANKVPDEVIIGHIASMKTKFDLSTEGLIELSKAGVSAAVIEAMRHPAPPAAVTKLLAPLRGGVEFDITLTEEVPMDPEPGTALHFQAAQAVIAEGAVVIAKGAAVRGEVLEPGKKNILGRGGKPIFRLIDVAAVDGSRLKVKASPGRGEKNERNIEPPGHRGKASLAPAGSIYQAYIDGDQTVEVKQR
jgi:serine/threonine-protein kinase